MRHTLLAAMSAIALVGCGAGSVHPVRQAQVVTSSPRDCSAASVKATGWAEPYEQVRNTAPETPVPIGGPFTDPRDAPYSRAVVSIYKSSSGACTMDRAILRIVEASTGKVVGAYSAKRLRDGLLNVGSLKDGSYVLRGQLRNEVQAEIRWYRPWCSGGRYVIQVVWGIGTTSTLSGIHAPACARSGRSHVEAFGWDDMTSGSRTGHPISVSPS